MRARIRSKWRNKDRAVSLEDNAVALAAVIWRVALAAAKNLHAEDFVYDSDDQRIGVIKEYQAFLIHLSDRNAFKDLDDKQRTRFVSTLARECGRHLQASQFQIMGPDSYQSAFTSMLNERMAEYAETSFSDGTPGYAALRCLADKVQKVMGLSQINRWVIDQIIELDAPDAVATVRQAMTNLFRSANVEAPPSFDST